MTATETTPTIIPLRTIRAWRPCADDLARVREIYPGGVPLTVEAGVTLREAGVDVLWGALRLLTDEERTEFILFTLRQRQPHLIALYKRAGLAAEAETIARLRFAAGEDAAKATPILERARDSARDSATDEQIAWVVETITARARATMTDRTLSACYSRAACALLGLDPERAVADDDLADWLEGPPAAPPDAPDYGAYPLGPHDDGRE